MRIRRGIIYILVTLMVLCVPLLSLASEAEESPRVTVELRGVEARGFLLAFGRLYGKNMIVEESVRGTLTVSLHEVPLESALQRLAESAGCRLRAEGGLIIIEAEAQEERRERRAEAREFRLMHITLDDSVLEAVRGVLGQKGSASALSATNSLVVKDTHDNMARVAALINSIDAEPVQILIEASIVEIASEAAHDLGIKWDAAYHRASGDLLGGGLGSTDTALGVNLPTGAGETGMNLGLALINDRLTLDVTISALEREGKARIVSAPRVQVTNNRRANISDGSVIIVPNQTTQTTVIGGGPQSGSQSGQSGMYETYVAALYLDVLPRVTAPAVVGGQSRIALRVDVRREEFDLEHEVQGYPMKNSRTAHTELILMDGQTVVLGGIDSSRQEDTQSGVPLLSDIPLLGWLFKGKSAESTRRELMIFLTPRVLKGAGPAVAAQQ